jgi:hypothetical protein
MLNIFYEDSFIAQPAIRLFTDVLEWQTRELLLPRLVSGEIDVG